jgi:hypothetical protein
VKILFRIRNLPAVSWLAVLFCLASACGMVAASLTVQCISASGHSQIEWIGQDPCRLSDRNPSAKSGSVLTGGWLDSAEPCFDMPLSFSGSQPDSTCLHRGHTRETGFVLMSIIFPWPAILEMGPHFRFAREPIPDGVAVPLSGLSLRI